MSANKSYRSHKNTDGEVDFEFYPVIRKYKDGRIERFTMSSFVPASADPATSHGVATRDVVIDQGTGSAGALIVSVEYRLAPEYPVPASYNDTWAALRWVATLSDPWLAGYADPRRTYLAGDSAGGNIVYHMAIRATHDDSIMDIEGLVIVHPFLWGLERLPAEKVSDGDVMYPPALVDKLWPFVTAGQAGNDDPRINPPDEEIALLTCRRVMVCVAGRDTLRDRGRRFASRMRKCGWTDRNLTVVETEGEDHLFHLYAPLRATSKDLMDRVVHFINDRATLPSPNHSDPRSLCRAAL
ncbi:probable carboxylesterase 2 [Triticum dicoccoides]|uniref:probable carboxylesterase 2 n=1 Tax=Triticum dicoccoides TaxID=85692 RepID=UPI00189032FD|nr:probable carboxylesterase 2 [Triticum dicoccoides]